MAHVPTVFGSNTSSSLKCTISPLGHLMPQVVALLLQRSDFTSLVEEEVGDHRLARNQDTCQQGQTCHLVGTSGAATT